ncbi:MAG: nucleoside triphosphate pyrophosphohydrolase [Bdellovibrionales bacterium]|nr:nucleoside triphosphate pyrophosphohydrolase [Bdellovibrionales bacterium]
MAKKPSKTVKKSSSSARKAGTRKSSAKKSAAKGASAQAPKAPASKNTAAAGRAQVLLDLIQTVYRLRAPGGCPWDREQTHQSLRPYLVEEAYEVLDVLDQIDSAEKLKDAKVREPFREELGDLLMQVVLHSEMTREAGAFDIFDVARGLNEKLIRRHPHVFGDTKVDGADAALTSWEKQKQKEKGKNPDSSVLDGLPKGMPSLQKAARVIDKVTRVGFQWDDMVGPLDKLTEELNELRDEILAVEGARNEDERLRLRGRVADEIGDLFFTLANVSYLSKIQPEDALRGTLTKFERRFRHVERRIKENGRSLEQSNLAEMDKYWNEAKAHERAPESRPRS